MNVQQNKGSTMNEMIRSLEDLIGRKADVTHLPLHPADMLTNWADVSKARRLLGWEPQVNLQEGMRSLVDWYMQERAWTSQVITA